MEYITPKEAEDFFTYRTPHERHLVGRIIEAALDSGLVLQYGSKLGAKTFKDWENIAIAFQADAETLKIQKKQAFRLAMENWLAKRIKHCG